MISCGPLGWSLFLFLCFFSGFKNTNLRCIRATRIPTLRPFQLQVNRGLWDQGRMVASHKGQLIGEPTKKWWQLLQFLDVDLLLACLLFVDCCLLIVDLFVGCRCRGLRPGRRCSCYCNVVATVAGSFISFAWKMFGYVHIYTAKLINIRSTNKFYRKITSGKENHTYLPTSDTTRTYRQQINVLTASYYI